MLENYNKYKEISPDIQDENGEFYSYDIIITKDLTDDYVNLLLQSGIIDNDTAHDLLNNQYKKGAVILNYPNNKLDIKISSHGVELEYLEDEGYFCRVATPKEIDNHILQQSQQYEKYTTEQLFLTKKSEIQKKFYENYKLMTSDNLIIACIIKCSNIKYKISTTASVLKNIISDVKNGSEFEFNLLDNKSIMQVGFEPPTKVSEFVSFVKRRISQYSRNKSIIVGRFNSKIIECKTIEELEAVPCKVWDFDGNNTNWKYDTNNNSIILDLTSIELASINIKFYENNDLIENQEKSQAILSQFIYNDNA